MAPDVVDPFPSERPADLVADSDVAPAAHRSASVPPGLTKGTLIAGKYELIRCLGTGAMGVVWAARHLSLDEEVAIKLVMKDVDHEDGTSSESRFLLEARVASTLSRKTRHIVGVTDHGVDGEYAYLVMELLDGESLDMRLARSGPKSLASIVPIVQQLARGLAVAHGEGVVHRDLKPSNVYVTLDEDGKALVKILDFGIAKLRASMRQIPLEPTMSAQLTKHATTGGFLLGTPAYMSPEQAKGRANLDHRCDVWALGVITYHLLTGEYPFDAETPEALLVRIQRAAMVPISEHRPDLPPIVHDFFRRAFALRIEDRFQSALAFAGAFEQLEPLAAEHALSLPPPMPPPRSAAPAAITLVEETPPPASEPGRRRNVRPPPPSVIAAGVPERGSLTARVVAALVVAAVVAGTAALIGVYLERDPSPNSRAASVGGRVTPRRDEIPPVGPRLEPSAAPARPAREAERPSVTRSAEPAPTTPTVTPAKRIDKSEIF